MRFKSINTKRHLLYSGIAALVLSSASSYAQQLPTAPMPEGAQATYKDKEYSRKDKDYNKNKEDKRLGSFFKSFERGLVELIARIKIAEIYLKTEAIKGALDIKGEDPAQKKNLEKIFSKKPLTKEVKPYEKHKKEPNKKK